MPVKNRKPVTYFSISKFDPSDRDKKRSCKVRTKQDGKEYFYDVIEGLIVRIELEKDEYEGEKKFRWAFHFEDENHDALEILTVGETSSAARGIITTLASIEGPLGWISIAPYPKKGEDGKVYTNTWIEHNGETVDWLDVIKDNVPETKEVPVGDKIYIDDSDRRRYYRALVARIKKEKLNISPEDFEAGKGRGGAPDSIDQMAVRNPTARHSEPEQSDDDGRPVEFAPPPPEDDDLPVVDGDDLYANPPAQARRSTKGAAPKHEPPADNPFNNPAYRAIIDGIYKNIDYLKKNDPVGRFMEVPERNMYLKQINSAYNSNKPIPEGKLREIAQSIQDACADCKGDDDLPF